MPSLDIRRATKPSGAFKPGSRVIDDTCDRLPADLVRRLLESPNVAFEEERWTPTRWLMKAVYEAVCGKGAAMSKLTQGLRSQQENEQNILDLYRKLSGDFGSSRDHVVTTGRLAMSRTEQSHVFSKNLRKWLHEVPNFVQAHLPSNWEPPPEPPAPSAGAIDITDKPTYQQTQAEQRQQR